MTASRRRPPDLTARVAALDVLEAIEADRGHSNALLAALPAGMPERDRALATELVYGVLRQRSQLDAAVGAASSRPLAQIDRPLLDILRIAAYQILFLSRVPWAAAVDEAVGVARQRAGRAASAFANGVLRALCRKQEEGSVTWRLPRPEKEADLGALSAWLAQETSFAGFLVDRFLKRHGPEEGEALLRTMNLPAPMVLRVGSQRRDPADLAQGLRNEGVETEPSPLPIRALRVRKGVPQRTALFRSGAFYIQDEASQIVAMLLEPLRPDERLVDLCAAPGGKILQVASAAGTPLPFMVAADRNVARLRKIRENARRGGIEGIHLVAMDAGLPALTGRFERVAVDAPCSGTGVIRRHPEIRWRISPALIERHAERQARTLRAALELLAPGGRLVYSVCSLEPEEGPAHVDAILRERQDVRLLDARGILPEALHHLVNPRGMLETLPHRHDMDGFFAAVLSLC